VAKVRRRAAKSLPEPREGKVAATAAPDRARLLHELQVHQVKLELQNEELRRIREELEQSLARYTSLYEAAPVGYLTLSRAGEIRQVNLTGARLLGQERARLVGGRLGHLLATESRPAMNAFLAKVFDSEATEVCEVVMHPEGAAPLTLELTGIPTEDGQACRVVAADITARRQAEEALRESEQRLSEAQELAQLGHWLWDVTTGAVKWSPQVFKIFQLDPRTFTPQIDSILDLSPWPEDHARDKELIRKAMESREKGSYEQRFLRPDGSNGYYQSTFQGRYDAAGVLVSIVGAVLDITERKRAEERIAGQLEELQRWQNVMLDREDRVQELKREVNELCHNAGESARYPSQEANSVDVAARKPGS
jgi:PAS domain S-box-containing protein